MLVERGPAVPPGTLKDQPDALTEATRPRRRYRHGRPLRLPRRTGRLRADWTSRAGGAGPGPEPVPQKLKVAGGERIQRDFTLRRRRPAVADDPRNCACHGTDGGPPVAGAIVIGVPIGARGPEPRGSADESGRFELPRPSGKSPGLSAQSQGRPRRLRDCRRRRRHRGHDRGQTGGDGPRPGRRLGGQAPRGRAGRLSDESRPRRGRWPRRCRAGGRNRCRGPVHHPPDCRSARGARCSRITQTAATRPITTSRCEDAGAIDVGAIVLDPRGEDARSPRDALTAVLLRPGQSNQHSGWGVGDADVKGSAPNE